MSFALQMDEKFVEAELNYDLYIFEMSRTFDQMKRVAPYICRAWQVKRYAGIYLSSKLAKPA